MAIAIRADPVDRSRIRRVADCISRARADLEETPRHRIGLAAWVATLAPGEERNRLERALAAAERRHRRRVRATDLAENLAHEAA